MSKVTEIPTGKRKPLYRFFEMLPALLSFGMVILLVVLSSISSVLGAIYLLLIVIMSLVKAIGVACRTVQGYKTVKKCIALDWKKRLEELEDPAASYEKLVGVRKDEYAYGEHLQNLCMMAAAEDGYFPKPSQIYHAVIVAMYNETLDVLAPTMDCLLKTTYPKKRMIVVIAYEERGGEDAEKDFIKLWGKILRLRNVLAAFDEFADDDRMVPREVQQYQGVYNELYERYRKVKKGELESIVGDIEFEMELARQVDVGIDYILMLVARYHASNCQDKEVRADISRAIDASPTLRDKRELIDRFIDGVNVTGASAEAWNTFVEGERDDELARVIADERLDERGTVSLMRRAWDEGYVRETGTAIMGILPRGGGGSLFSRAPTGLTATRERVLEKLKAFFERFHEIVGMPGDHRDMRD